ncbi:MAG: ribonuclease Y [Firmicutes bacterium GWF2_51_9]|nr:ribonuclease Y [Erysipelotrichaceae bacterium]OGS54207.1 MAG: ribonuclease Y [Firmicutes bacterium GWF2_51_9]OGS58099.1 MAG: ribonuclease Y [Firmicutes bacterium GWE2_51_13]HAO60670.1 ribonuclease Y [Erysipelotrichaceae bacterium]HBZ41255.1 ribonuclease Y [Erysipelotrichaceae bacterium]
MPKDILFSVLAGISGFALGLIVMVLVSKLGLNRDQQKASLLISEATNKADNLVRQAVLEGKTQAYELKLAAEKEIKERRQEIQELENKMSRREDNFHFREETLTNKEKQIDDKNKQLTEKLNVLEKMERDLQSKIDIQVTELERFANMTQAEAKKELMSAVEKKIQNEVTAYIREAEDDAKSIAADKARNIIGMAIQRYAQEETLERTVSVVALPSEEMKGRIIGREGRNIRAIEQATGVDLIIDDTPETITLSCFDPIRREIARLALETLIKDGRIQPGRIEEVVNKVTKELNETIQKVGEEAVFKLNIGKIDREIVGLIGRLRYRYSYGQNALQHSMEVAYLAGMMAAELGLNQTLAKRAALLHDIGKAMDFEVEGSHIEIGARIAKKHGENAVVINSIESHHGEVEPTSIISVLVAAADTLSAARPGARFESFENYIQRLEQLEKIATSFDGVEKTYAIQAGREIRVMVVPEKLDDMACHRIAREIREKIEAELTYPGQIKVTVIRETRASDIAK